MGTKSHFYLSPFLNSYLILKRFPTVLVSLPIMKNVPHCADTWTLEKSLLQGCLPTSLFWTFDTAMVIDWVLGRTAVKMVWRGPAPPLYPSIGKCSFIDFTACTTISEWGENPLTHQTFPPFTYHVTSNVINKITYLNRRGGGGSLKVHLYWNSAWRPKANNQCHCNAEGSEPWRG